MTRPSNIVHLHRIVELPVRTLPEIAREAEGQHKVDLFEALRDRPSTFERIADALGSRDFFIFYCGIYAGCLLTVALAYCWSFYL